MAFQVGQAVVCVDARAIRDDIAMPLVEGARYTIVGMQAAEDCPVFGTGIGLHFAEIESLTTYGWLADRFRPLADAPARVRSMEAV